jgi:hypothetical protein
MIVRQIEHRGRVGLEAGRAFELKARKLEHESVRQGPALLYFGQRIEHRHADIAGDDGVEPCRDTDVARHARDGALAVGAGDRDDPRRSEG